MGDHPELLQLVNSTSRWSESPNQPCFVLCGVASMIGSLFNSRNGRKSLALPRLLLVHASTGDVCGRLFGRVLFGTSFLCTVLGRLRGNSRGGRFWCLSAWLTKRGSAVHETQFLFSFRFVCCFGCLIFLCKENYHLRCNVSKLI